AAGMTATIPVELIPKRRGVHKLGQHQISTSFPFGFVKRAVTRTLPATLLVYPPIAQVDPRLLQLARSAEEIGPTVRPRRGGMDEFYGLKEYRQGESPRLIYWRRSARTGTLVTREMTHVSPPRLLLLVDTFIPQRTLAAHADVEMCIAMAASLVSHAIEADLPVGVIAWNDGFRAIEPQRGKRHRRELLTFLAALPLNTRRGTDELIAAAYDTMDYLVTPVLFTAAEAPKAPGLVIRPHSPLAERWFRFDPKLDFAHAMPLDQQPPRYVQGQGDPVAPATPAMSR
ncbi:MAG: DUF58 domain-containing protein, partial [Phycisphaerae bacterium]|nr:DUF58 domain-containing protein [Phycisphaerae bacterium]